MPCDIVNGDVRLLLSRLLYICGCSSAVSTVVGRSRSRCERMPSPGPMCDRWAKFVGADIRRERRSDNRLCASIAWCDCSRTENRRLVPHSDVSTQIGGSDARGCDMSGRRYMMKGAASLEKGKPLPPPPPTQQIHPDSSRGRAFGIFIVCTQSPVSISYTSICVAVNISRCVSLIAWCCG